MGKNEQKQIVQEEQPKPKDVAVVELKPYKPVPRFNSGCPNC